MNQKSLYTILGLIIVAGGAMAIVWAEHRVFVTQQQAAQTANETVTQVAKQAQTRANSSTQTTTKLSYSEALKKYGSNRIQFDQTCQMIPNSVVYKSGTQVMFDNRASIKHVINFNGRKITIAAYDYAVVSMTANSYPTTIVPDCDKLQNVGKILIEK